MKNKSIKIKITFFVGGIILALLLFQIIFSYFFGKAYLIRYKSSKIESLYKEINENWEELEEVIRGYEERYNLRVVVFDRDFNVNYATGDKNIMAIKKNVGELLYGNNEIGFKREARAYVQKNNREFGEGIILRGIISSGNIERFVVIETPLVAVEESVNILAKANLYITFIMLIIGVIVAYLFAKRFSKPIEEIDKVAKNVANLDFTLKASEVDSKDEIGNLSRNINTMSIKLEELICDLKRDIDKQKQLENMRREFIANVSHELKTPLFLLMLYSENLQKNVEGIDKDYYCQVIVEESKKLNEMVKNLLEASKIENGLTKMSKEKISFGEFSKECIEKSLVIFEKSSIKLEEDYDDGLLIKGDPFYLEQAIKNFLINAIKHTREGGKIKVEAKKGINKVCFSVFNEGENIEEEILQEIWESFYRADKARVRDEEGSVGLGLYIVKTIINAHSGEYGVRNVKEGVEFWFSINLVE